MPEIDFSRQSKRNLTKIENIVDWLMADPVYNIKAVPDVIERQIYQRLRAPYVPPRRLSALSSS